MELCFYQTGAGNLVPSAARLLEKIYASGERCLVYSADEERLKAVDKTLWTFSTNAFIPHGDRNLGFCHRQPIYLTNQWENPNGATILLLLETVDHEQCAENFKRIICIFQDAPQIERAQAIYDDLKKNQENVNYWKQSSGGWEKVT
ncbi:MAG: DNA polymerase III subunit chi [Holosporaceae bacterium]|nr:DNA polymerase III subunit chi [Holosporaceae bacterium]